MTKEKRISLANVLVVIGLLLLLVMASAPLFNDLIDAEWMRWGYTAGALIVLVGRLVGYDNDGTLRVKRLQRILMFSGLLYCASASVRFIYSDFNNWIAFLLAGLVIQLYASWMIDREVKKNEK